MKDKSAMLAGFMQELNKPASKEDVRQENKRARKPSSVSKPKAKPRAKAAASEGSAQLEQMTVKLRPTVRKRILAESFRRKADGLENWQIQEIITEAVSQYLGDK